MAHNQKQAANEYAEQARTLADLAEQLKAYADSLFDVRGPEEVTWGDVELLKAVNNQLGCVLSLVQTDDAM